jgi:glutamine synthetase
MSNGKKRDTAADVVRMLRQEKYEALDLKFVDLFGALQHVTVPTEQVDEGLFGKGFGFDGSSVRGFQPINESDMTLRPDPKSAFPDPFFDDPTLSVFCDVIDPRTHDIYSRDSRGLAQRAQQLVRSLGIADTAYFGPEPEFFIFDDVRFDQTTQHGFYYVNSEGAFWQTGSSSGRNPGHRARRKQAYYAAAPVDQFQNLRAKMSKTFAAIGIEPELHHHEVAAAGQNEIGFRFGQLTEQADRVVKFKYAVKNVAHRYDKTATFMPKPLFEENGSGMHVHVSLWKEGRNLFYEAGRYGDLSELGRLFIGGILHHAAALCAFCAPTTNSYRRLVPGYEAPINLVYSANNRSACIRIPATGTDAKAKRIEFRTPDPSCNPYLAFAAILLAGIDGIKNRIEPPDPIDDDIYELTTTEAGKSIQNAPGSFEKALDALEQDHEFLVRDGVFTEALIDLWVRLKRENEVNFISLRPHPSEFMLYFDA